MLKVLLMLSMTGAAGQIIPLTINVESVEQCKTVAQQTLDHWKYDKIKKRYIARGKGYHLMSCHDLSTGELLVPTTQIYASKK